MIRRIVKFDSIAKVLNLLYNMKLRYVVFRIMYLIKIKIGWMKFIFPTSVPYKVFITKQEWINSNIPFFFNSKESLSELARDKKYNTILNELPSRVSEINNNTFTFFYSTKYKLTPNYDWITNPSNGYKYDVNRHWSEIQDYSKEAGDIKFVWEKSRFTFLYDLIRYDFHFKKDQSDFVFTQIESFIDNNPINLGPNYKCSQEIAIRVFNWTFALFYYKHSKRLTDLLFNKIQNSIYWQINHVYKNINFSRIAVRNNHAITETALLYLSGLLFPYISETKKWSKKGLKWLQKEIEYQIYNDGSYLQYSHNYHRVVVQLLTWVLKLSELNNRKLDKIFYINARKTVNFLFQNQENNTGWLPNYGNNDGALFFPLNGNHYRDFRPQLQGLACLLNINLYSEKFEDLFWYGITTNSSKKLLPIKNQSLIYFPNGGFYGFRDNSLTIIRCGAYKDRPSQADALNIDIWVDGINILRDPGTYKYNTKDKYLNFYNGTIGHNTLSIGNSSQMIKGGRFIWFNWTKNVISEILEKDKVFEFKGQIEAFPQHGKGIIHKREVIKLKNKNKWEIIDSTNYTGHEDVFVFWNLNPIAKQYTKINAYDDLGNEIKYEKRKGWHSELYGIKEDVEQYCFKVPNKLIKTIIEIQK